MIDEGLAQATVRRREGATPRPAAVLVVNDDQSELTTLHQLLEPLDLEVESAESGEAALIALENRDYSAILLEVNLSGIDGFETARLIRQRARSWDTPILFLTDTATGADDQDRGYRLGAVDYLFGTPRPSVLRAKVAALVKLAEARRSANAANAAKSEFMSLAAHELRAPLGVIGGYTAMLADGTFGQPLEAWRQPLEMIEAKVAEIDALISDLLLVAKLEAGEVPLTRVSVDLELAVRQAVGRALPRVAMREGTITVESPEIPTFGSTDATQLAHILDNLINNAINYSSSAPRITLSLTGSPQPAISVTDEGAGIPEDARQRIFERMTRLHPPGLENVAGTGLGLYLCRTLARRLDGDLVLAWSEVGAGSRFELSMAGGTAPHEPEAPTPA